ncbi:RecX family transcriptional regulator [Actinotalea ferrariae CF5-4]|uniref:Regulatory protein RecX n=1 Tax=Actinotalea ferrariae CF5-4 TaxID=948458 RepID=A0A021VTJ6_9CELL|nr:RecX family transcriptional regulator [Actinotalea ferrariae CF5-4]
MTGAPRSRHQLEQALAKRGVDPQVTERVLDRFTEVGLIDDAEYAHMLVRSQRESRGLARRALALELRRRGVVGPEAEDALATVQPEDEEESARTLLRRKWHAGRDLAPEVRARRATAMLARKGYSGSLVSRLVREMMDGSGSGDSGLPVDPWEPEALE